jgi:hypothetical protein
LRLLPVLFMRSMPCVPVNIQGSFSRKSERG